MSAEYREFMGKIYQGEYLEVVVTTIRCVFPNISPQDLDECISEVYMTAMVNGTLDKHPNIHGWLNNTSKNMAMRLRKQMGNQNKRRAPDFTEAFNVADSESTNPVEMVEQSEQDAETSAFLEDNLKVGEFTLYTLKFIDELPNTEISEITGIKKHTVDVQITRLKEKIKKLKNL